MADYIYLMQNRLNPAQWRALEVVREAARTNNMPVFLVGGAVRDLTTGTPVRDLDFAVQGDVALLREELERRGGTVAGENATLQSLYILFRGGVRAEVGPTIAVSYPKPGKAKTQPAAILDDLRRRDFTANAMAVSLNEGSYGLLLDPLNGTADIENREFRLVSPYGFIEQPALLLRAARLTERLGWSLEERTAARYETSKEEGHIEALPAPERAYELEEIFHEEDPVGTLAHLESEGWRDALYPSLELTEGDRGNLDEVRELIGQLEAQGLHPDSSAVFFPFLTSKLRPEERAKLKGLFPRQGFVQQIETLEARSKELAAQLTSKAASAPSDALKLIREAEPEVVLYLAYHSKTGAAAGKIKAFLKEWPQMRQKIPYALMQEMRITPELPGYDKLLDDLFFALIDGKLDTPEATRAFLEPYSPPAPPQVTVRRRPAKAARRSKRAAEEVADSSEADEDEDNEDSSADSDEDETEKDEVPGLDAERLGASDEDHGEDEDDEEDDEDEEERAPVGRAKAAKPALVTSRESALADQSGPGAVDPEQPTTAAKTKASSAAKESGPKTSEPSAGKRPAKNVVVVAPAKAAAAATKASGKGAAVKAPAVKVSAVKVVVTAKSPAKSAPPVKAAGKGEAPAKKSVAPPVKASGKTAPAKATPPAVAKAAATSRAKAAKAVVKAPGNVRGR